MMEGKKREHSLTRKKNTDIDSIWMQCCPRSKLFMIQEKARVYEMYRVSCSN